jgi:hypothetical protein
MYNMVDLTKKDSSEIEEYEKHKSGKISGGTVVVTEEEIAKDKISGGSAVVVNNLVDVNKISGGAVVICFGPVKVSNKISGVASVISDTRIKVGEVKAAANLVAAPVVDERGSSTCRNRVSVSQALKNPRVTRALRERFGVTLDGDGTDSLPELVDR